MTLFLEVHTHGLGTVCCTVEVSLNNLVPGLLRSVKDPSVSRRASARLSVVISWVFLSPEALLP
jgi:hypothetical protein